MRPRSIGSQERWRRKSKKQCASPKQDSSSHPWYFLYFALGLHYHCKFSFLVYSFLSSSFSLNPSSPSSSLPLFPSHSFSFASSCTFFLFSLPFRYLHIYLSFLPPLAFFISVSKTTHSLIHPFIHTYLCLAF
ncbi:hypothetical protein BKA57DRAFT_90718 [Linnemannia elongata]|nr:hypothetical protein BKA57DRAFT_90718 [Linnemannia elongata]